MLGERDLDEDDPLAMEISGLNKMEKGLMKVIKGAEEIMDGVQMQKRGLTLFREQYWGVFSSNCVFFNTLNLKCDRL